MRARETILAVALAVAALACGPDLGWGPEPDPVTLTFRIQGLVTDSASAAPLAGAQVDFGSGGHFSFPAVIVRVRTDTAGHYAIHSTYTYRAAGCPFLWVQVSRQGYRTTSAEDVRHGVECTEGSQTIDIALVPQVSATP